MSVYLDQAATSYPKPEVVYRAVDRFMREVGVSSGRGAYRRALEADRVVYETRRSLARLFNVRDPSRIVFTSNATESLNLAMKGLLCAGDHVVTTSMEHNAVWRCLKALEGERGIAISVAPCAPDGSLQPGTVENLLRPNTRLVVMLHASNVTGTIMPVEKVGELCRSRGITFLVDAAQTAGVLPIDAEAMHIDLLAFTGHKGLLGPTGTGGLFVREGLYLRPLKVGGTGSESLLEYQPETLPDRFEAGTLNVSGLAGLGAAVDFILGETVEKIREKEMALTRQALTGLSNIPGVTLYGPRDAERQVAVFSFNLNGVSPAHVAYVLDEVYGIMTRAGLHCAPCAHRTIGTIEVGTVRASCGYFNSEADVDLLCRAVEELSAGLPGGKPS